jgi:TRAP-type C4-dicarboxylate transport system permease small subunit
MKKIIDFLFYLLKLIAAICLTAMVVMVFSNVVLRYVFNSGIAVSEELSSWCMTWMTYTAGLVALRNHDHLGFDTVLAKLPEGVQRFFLTIAHLLMIGLMWLFLDGSWKQTVINLDNVAPASGISTGVLYGVGILFGAVAILILLGDLYDILTGKLRSTLSSEAKEALAEVAAHDAALPSNTEIEREQA